MTNLDLLRENLENLKTIRTKLRDALDAGNRVSELWEKMRPEYEDLSRLVVGPNRKLSAEDFARRVCEIPEQKEIDGIRKRIDQIRAELQDARTAVQPLLDSFRSQKTAAAFKALEKLPDGFGLLECDRFIALVQSILASSTRGASGAHKHYAVNREIKAIRILIILLRSEGLTQKAICARLDQLGHRPPANTTWKHYRSWAEAFKLQPLKVGPWLSRQK
jgi:hypothetical protein